MTAPDSGYLDILLEPIRISAQYQPRFGQRRRDGLSLAEFRNLYGSDPFYAWLGLDTPLMYTAHKAAGGITSVYRQIGIGCERLVRHILRDALKLSESDVEWSYTVRHPDGTRRQFSLDARISLDRITDPAARSRVREWMLRSARSLDVDPKIAKALSGAVFEVRQGYKSKDSKRQDADIANAAAAYTQRCLPCVLLLSRQMDEDVMTRYRLHRWVVLTGTLAPDDPLVSTYAFFREVVGYDLASFFSRNQTELRREVEGVLEALLSGSSDRPVS